MGRDFIRSCTGIVKCAWRGAKGLGPGTGDRSTFKKSKGVEQERRSPMPAAQKETVARTEGCSRATWGIFRGPAERDSILSWGTTRWGKRRRRENQSCVRGR